MLEIYIWISFEILSHCLFLFFFQRQMMLNLMSLVFFVFYCEKKRSCFDSWEIYWVKEKQRQAGWTEEREQDGIVSSAVKYHVLLLRTETFLPMFLGNLSHQYHLFFLFFFYAGFLSLLLLLTLVCSLHGGSVVRRPSLCVLLRFLWGVDSDFFVNNKSCHWLPCPWLLLPWFLSDKSRIVPHVLLLLLADIGPLLFFFFFFFRIILVLFCFAFLRLSWSDWGIIAKLNTFRAIAHFFPHSLPVMSELFKGLFHRACWPHASPACDWLTLCLSIVKLTYSACIASKT